MAVGVVAVLGAGAFLDALDRLGLQATRPLAVLCGLVVFLLSSGACRGEGVYRLSVAHSGEGRNRTFVALAASFLSMGLLLSELVRFNRRGGHSGFPIWLSDLYHEDNSSWISLGENSQSGDWLDAKNFGFAVALIQGAMKGVSSVFAALLGLPLSSIGVSITAVGLTYVLLTVVIPIVVIPIVQITFERTASLLAALALGVTVALFLLRFMREVRDLGHLSAGLTVLALLYSVRFVSSGLRGAEFSQSDPLALWCLSFSCFLWFPLRPLALVFALIATWLDLVNRDTRHEGSQIWSLSVARLRGVVFLAAVVIRTVPDVRSYISPQSAARTKALVNATGATYDAFDFFLLLGAIVVFSVIVNRHIGSPVERLVLSLIVLFGIGIRFVDQIASPEFEYGSTKMLWILLAPIVFLSAILLVRDLPILSVRKQQYGAVFLGLSMLLANSTSYFGVARVFGPFIWSDVRGSFVELDNPLAMDSFVQWDEPGGLDLRQTRIEMPIMCVMIDELDTRPLPAWEFEPYRCTRKVSELSGEQSRARGTLEPGLDQLWKEYALLDRSLIEAVMGSLKSGNDLSRDTLLLSRDGEIVGRERTVDLLAQITFSDPVAVSSHQRWTGSIDGSAVHNLDTLDPIAGTLDLWVSRDVVSVVLVGDIETDETTVDRRPRTDVAELLGRDELFSGLTIEHPAITRELRCIVLVNRSAEGTLAWTSGDSCA